ncbi:MAG: endonuclease domain-containing protein [Dehalococcoidia bacterium]|nr:endonuclease domain-containing protein [Dehalococcoidia bacterium]MYD50810.1 endonuclease domain-containing protein [Dehalococcoidia bacterium]
MTQISRARELRKQSTDAERLLWSRLRDRRLMGLKFRRQSPIGRYVVDFVCYEHNLIVEIDGGHHQEQRASDLRRTEWLNSCGFSVIRYWNNQVLEDMDSVLESIRMTLEVELSPSPQPSP